MEGKKLSSVGVGWMGWGSVTGDDRVRPATRLS